MAWNPPGRVEANEHLGRRLFDEPMLSGDAGPRYQGLDLRNFLEKRDREFSLDRLGRSSVDRSVKAYLKPRATAAGYTFTPSKTFNGWAVLKARQLAEPPRPSIYGKFSPTPSPVHALDGQSLTENIYHAHIELPDADLYSIALHLKELFATYGSVERTDATPRGDQDTVGAVVKDYLRQLRLWFGQLFRGEEKR